MANRGRKRGPRKPADPKPVGRPKAVTLTARQKEFLEDLATLLRQGIQPALRDIMAVRGLKAGAAAHAHMHNLIDKGYVVEDTLRGWQLTELGYAMVGWRLKKCKSCQHTSWVPVY